MKLVYMDRDEAIARMHRRNKTSVCWTLPSVQIEWKYIQATNMRNWDGTFAGAGEDPAHTILQQKIHREGECPRFVNHHGFCAQ